MKSALPVALLALVIIVAAARLIWFYTSQPAAGEPITHYMPVACAACGRAYADNVGKEPTRCRFCGQLAGWRAQQCGNPACREIFPLVRDRHGDLAAQPVRCPKCGSAQVGEVDVHGLDEP